MSTVRPSRKAHNLTFDTVVTGIFQVKSLKRWKRKGCSLDYLARQIAIDNFERRRNTGCRTTTVISRSHHTFTFCISKYYHPYSLSHYRIQNLQYFPNRSISIEEISANLRKLQWILYHLHSRHRQRPYNDSWRKMMIFPTWMHNLRLSMVLQPCTAILS